MMARFGFHYLVWSGGGVACSIAGVGQAFAEAVRQRDGFDAVGSTVRGWLRVAAVMRRQSEALGEAASAQAEGRCNGMNGAVPRYNATLLRAA